MDRRTFLAGALGVGAATPALAALDPTAPSLLRGTLTPAELGLDPAAAENQSETLQALLDMASAKDRQVFLPAGSYTVSNLRLPARTRLSGVPGATRLVFGGGDQMITAEGAEIVELSGLTFDGAHDAAAGIRARPRASRRLRRRRDRELHVRRFQPVGPRARPLIGPRLPEPLQRPRRGGHPRGRIDRAVDHRQHGGGLRQRRHSGLRWSAGEDGTIVTGNRVRRIAAKAGGTGQNGNGINVFRAHGVTVANNAISDCAFTAVRANSANNVQITGNNCRNSGEVGIYSEFSFEGAIIANNIVDGAATGICVVNFDEGGRIAAVTGNIVRNLTGVGPYDHEPPGFGIGIAIEADVAATGNVIDGAPLYGMSLGFGPYLRDVAATGNVIRGAPVGVAVTVVEGAGSAVISDNLISGATEGAVVGMRWAEAATGDLALTGARGYPHLLVERNRIS